jgi:ABC-type bacteriocin/lantibiotic exporter with double-glycine peptidase domain
MAHAVPHFYQSREQACGRACLRMLAARLGRTIDEATIAQSCGMTSLGCTIQDLLAGAQVLAFQAKLLRISSE